MDKFRVGISGDFYGPDGAPAYPDFDLTPLKNDPHVEIGDVPVVDGVIRADDLAGHDAMILLGGKCRRDSLPGDGRLAMVARFGVGYDNVDIDACSDNAVAAVITPDGVRRPVAVAIMTLMLAVTGKLLTKDRLTRAGPDGWAQKSRHMGVGLVGKTLGTVGIGNIGAELFRLAKPFDMKFMAYDPYADAAVAASLGVRMVDDLATLFREADVLTVNCPWSKETEGLVSAELLGLMKPSAYVINTARGPIVDQPALTGRAIVRDARLFLFDEPLSNLDAQLREEMRAEIKRLHQELGKTMIYVTHDQIEAMTLADRIVLLRDGRIEQQGAPLELFERPATRFVAGFLGSPSMNFVPATLAATNGTLSVVFADGAALALPPDRHDGLAARAGQGVTFGVRTEHLSRARDGAARAGLARLPVTIELIQPTGSRTYATFQLAGTPVVAELLAHDVERPGERLELHVDMNRVVLIDPATDAVIGTGEAAA